jgi:hypothetical protein
MNGFKNTIAAGIIIAKHKFNKKNDEESKQSLQRLIPILVSLDILFLKVISELILPRLPVWRRSICCHNSYGVIGKLEIFDKSIDIKKYLINLL